MSALDFTEAEVLEELRDLGYDNIPRDKLEEFMTDLKQLMRHHDDSRRSRDETDFSFASSVSGGVDDRANASSISSDGLARYPHHTDFHWGRGHHRRGGDKSNNNAEDAVDEDDVVDVSIASTPRSAFEKSKVPLDENSFYNESFFSQNEKNQGSNRRRQYHSHNSNAVDDDRTSPKCLVNDHSIASSASSSANSLVVRRKVSRRDANGNRDISTHELTYVEDDDDEDAATLAGDDAVLDDDDAPNLTMTRRIVGRRPRSAGSESSDASSTCSSRALPSFIRPQPEVRRRRCDPVNRYHQYNEAWTTQRAPGEKQHKQLRWAVREQMQRRDEIVTPVQKYYVPNEFVPPTDKKRQNLRWEIRTKLAHKLNPSKNTQSPSFNIWT